MATMSPEKQGENKALSGKMIMIAGPQLFQNELIAFFLHRETGADCRTYKRPSEIPDIDLRNSSQPGLILFDCPPDDHRIFFKRLDMDCGEWVNSQLFALFNVAHASGLEEEAIGRGFKGVFYENASLASFIKGVRAIFRGELWFSRDVLTRCVTESRGKAPISNQDLPFGSWKYSR